MALTRATMYYNDYAWTPIPGDSPRVTGPPDSTLLSRREGYEVLYFVNRFCSANNLLSLDAHHKVERMIRLCPPNLHSQINVYNWILNNWTAH